MSRTARVARAVAAIALCFAVLGYLFPYWSEPLWRLAGRYRPEERLEAAAEEQAPSGVERIPATPEEIRYDPLSGFSSLTPVQQEAYNLIVQGYEQLASSVDLEYLGITAEDLDAVLAAVDADCPQYFYATVAAYQSDPVTGAVVSAEYAKSEADEIILQRRANAEAWRQALLAEIPAGSSNAEAALYLHDRLVDMLTYNADAENNQNILSVIETSSSVCAGYSKAYAWLLQGAGIFCIYVPGEIETEPHAWNLVKIDGEYGWVDATWDDPSFIGSNYSYVSHTYYGISTADLLLNHSFDRPRPEYDGIAEPSFNYFRTTGLDFDLDTDEGFAALAGVADAVLGSDRKVIEFRLADKSQATEAVTRLMFARSILPDFFEFNTGDTLPVVTVFHA